MAPRRRVRQFPDWSRYHTTASLVPLPSSGMDWPATMPASLMAIGNTNTGAGPRPGSASPTAAPPVREYTRLPSTNWPELLMSPSSKNENGIPRLVTAHRSACFCHSTTSPENASPHPASRGWHSTLPRTWPRSLMSNAELREYPGSTPRSSRPPSSVQKNACAGVGGGSMVPWHSSTQLVPTTCPRSLIATAALQLPAIVPTSTSSYSTVNSSIPTPLRPRLVITATSYRPVSASAATVMLAISFAPDT